MTTWRHRLERFAPPVLAGALTMTVLSVGVVATVLVAALRRDPNYLLGSIVSVPWFAFNFFAAQELKSTFVTYSRFPFITAMFWVLVYGAKLAPPARRFAPASSRPCSP